MKLSSREIISFHNDGFLCVDRPMIAALAIRRMQSVYDALFAGRAAYVDGLQFDLARTNEEGVEAASPQVINPDLYALELRDCLLGTGDVVVKQLLGSSVRAEIYHANLKTAKGVGATPLHQDEAHWDPELQYHSVSIWRPPQEAAPENGCMFFNRGVTNGKCWNTGVLVATGGFAV